MHSKFVGLHERVARNISTVFVKSWFCNELYGCIFFINTDSGVGAGIDSYYEYCLKAYILLGEEDYLNRFNQVNFMKLKAYQKLFKAATLR